MPNSKTLVIFIMCFGIVVSTYLLSQKPENNLSKKNNIGVLTDPQINEEKDANNDWQKILTNVDSSSVPVTLLINNDDYFVDNTSLTSQMSKDFFSRYLLIAKNDSGVTESEAVQIANEVLSAPEYTSVKGPVYVPLNIKTTEKTDRDTVANYNNMLFLIYENRKVKTVGDPLEIVNIALNTENEKDLSKLDPFITAYKNTVSDLIKIEVPVDAVYVHLGLVNGYSDILSTLESLRLILKDPIKGMAGIAQYEKSLVKLEVALSEINSYFEKRLGTLQ